MKILDQEVTVGDIVAVMWADSWGEGRGWREFDDELLEILNEGPSMIMSYGHILVLEENFIVLTANITAGNEAVPAQLNGTICIPLGCIKEVKVPQWQQTESPQLDLRLGQTQSPDVSDPEDHTYHTGTTRLSKPRLLAAQT